MADNYINKTDAKEIVLHFYKLKGWRPDANMGRSINTVTALLKKGFTKEEITSVIDYVMTQGKVDVHSIGYFNHCINTVLAKIKQEQLAEQARKIKAEARVTPKEVDNGSTNRNKEKLARDNSKPNIGKKYNFDLFEG